MIALWRRRHQPWVMVWPLAVAQLVSWGCVYYSFSLFVVPIEDDLGWSKADQNLALTIALLTLAVCVYPLARWLDRYGGRLPMTAAALIGGGLLVSLGSVETLTAYYLLWAGIGVCMSALLYEPAFAVVTQIFGAKAKQGITAVTLVAGFSSTVFVPLVEYWVQNVGWRETYEMLGVTLWAVSLPIHWLFVPSRRIRHDIVEQQPAAFALRRTIRDRLFISLTVWSVCHAFILVGLFFQLVPLWKSHGVERGVIVTAIAVMGPMQVFGRVVVMLMGERLSLITLGVVTTAVFPFVVVALMAGPMVLLWLGAALGLFGMANGINTILRGAIPAEWFEREHYAKVAGAIAVPVIVVGSIAPWSLASIWQRFGEAAMWFTVLAVALLGLAAFLLAAHFRSVNAS